MPRSALVAALLLASVAVAETPAPTAPPPPPAEHQLATKWVRDSAEYAWLARQVYADATEEVLEAAKGTKRSVTWAVVLDVDETALDNSTYQLERAAYGLPFELASWNAWVERREARAVPGTAGFVDAVREAGGRVAYVTNRDEATREATRANLEAQGLWKDGDALCLATDRAYTKAVRRAEVREGSGPCGWKGTKVTVLAYVGDQLGDFPDAAEDGAAGDPPFGERYFLLPNPMYGGWTSKVTRPAP